MRKAEGYKQLVERFGEGEVADRLLAKWLTDADSAEELDHLAAVVTLTNGVAPRRTYRQRPKKYWVVLWYFSMGYRASAIAEQLGIGTETVKQEIKYARRQLGVAGKPLPHVVAAAIREGRIP